ncbi:hypothetical protein C8Q78DRAFT_398807 [Trametes maxima]|nr:hypothetical protein C8Q78DRAFT_398807 [Trametes maxima]
MTTNTSTYSHGRTYDALVRNRMLRKWWERGVSLGFKVQTRLMGLPNARRDLYLTSKEPHPHPALHSNMSHCTHRDGSRLVHRLGPRSEHRVLSGQSEQGARGKRVNCEARSRCGEVGPALRGGDESQMRFNERLFLPMGAERSKNTRSLCAAPYATFRCRLFNGECYAKCEIWRQVRY